MASAELQWQIVRKYNRYLTRNAVGDRKYFSTEPTNIRKAHTSAASGLVNRKSIGVVAPAEGKGVVVIIRRSKANGPKDAFEKVHMKKGARAINKSITNITKKHNYRSDLTQDAIAAASQILRSQQRKSE